MNRSAEFQLGARAARLDCADQETALQSYGSWQQCTRKNECALSPQTDA
jgi:hypothetical protein